MAEGTKLTFNVNVKVEECDDDEGIDEEKDNYVACEASTQNTGNDKITIIDIDDSDEYDTSDNSNQNSKSMNVFKYQGGDIEEIPAPSNEVGCEPTYSTADSGTDKKFYLIRKGLLYTLTNEIILKGIEEQSKLIVNKSDWCIYRAIKKYYPDHNLTHKTFHEKLVDSALEQWKKWKDNCPRLRDSPLLYKCYLCNRGWWRLQPFREHITIHKNPKLNISLEEIHHECHLAAGVGLTMRTETVRVGSNCWRCNKPIKNHAMTRKLISKYKCERCYAQLHTCDQFAIHQSACKIKINVALNSLSGQGITHGMLCKICCLYCPSQLALDNHMTVYHTPRSDEPNSVFLKVCNLCSNVYHVRAYHDCPKRWKRYKCPCCFNRFISKTFLNLHMVMNKGVATCPDCYKNIKQCYLLEHMLKHSANFDMCEYCVKCKTNVLYTTDKRFKMHMHHHGIALRRRWGTKILLPLKCIRGEIIESAVKLDVTDTEIYKHLDRLDLMGKSLNDIVAVLRRDKAIGRMKSKVNPETESAENIVSDYEQLDNYAFQIQLDAEIQRDIEIEAEISKVFKASDCYQKFLEKETNEPINDDYNDDVYMIEQTEDVLVISDSDSDDDGKGNDTKKCDTDETFACNSRAQTDSNHSIEETNSNDNIKVKIESCDNFIEEPSNVTNTDNISDIDIKDEPVSITLNQNSQSNVQDERDNLIPDIASGSENVPSGAVKHKKERECFDEKIKREIESDEEESIDFLQEGIYMDSDIKLEDDCGSDVDIKSQLNYTDNENEEIVNDTSDWNINSVEMNKPETSGNKKPPVRRNPKGRYKKAMCPLLYDGRHEKETFACKKCPYNGTFQQYIQHVAAKCPSRGITCTYCNKAFNNIRLYLRHLPEHNLKYLACTSCNKNFNVDVLFVDHMAKHICELFLDAPGEHNRDAESNMYVCKICEQSVEIEGFFEHWELHLDLNVGNNENSGDLTDSNDLNSLMSPDIVKITLEMLVSKPFNLTKCFVCDKTCSRKNDAKRHLIEHLLHEARVKSTNGCLQCPVCDLEIEKIIDWRQHMRDHAHLKIYKCNLCMKRFSDSSNYSKHRKVHNEFSYICDQCGGKYRARTSIIRHLAKHKQNPVSCPECMKTFYSNSCLKKHLRSKHTPHSFICNVCRRRFGTLKLKWDHMWEQHQQRKLAADCPICKKEYRRIIDVRYHLKLEHGISRHDINYKALRYRDVQSDDVTEQKEEQNRRN